MKSFLLISLITAGSLNSNQESKISISAKLKYLEDGTSFYLVQKREGKLDTIQIVKSKNSKFEFETTNLDVGQIYFIKTNALDNGNNPNRTSIRLIFEAASIHISGNIQQWPKVKIENSEATDIYEKYHDITQKYRKSYDSIAAIPPYDNSKLQAIMSKYVDFSMEYFKNYKNSSAIPLLISNNPALDLNHKEIAYNYLSNFVKKTSYGKKLNNEIEMLIIRSRITVGGKLPDFKVESLKGYEVSITTLIKKSKYTLIDFWAYWCSPCKEDIPAMKVAYEKYNDNQFNIVSISIDPNRSKWEKCLEEINTKWDNVIDQNKISKTLFSIQAIPGYLLVDSSSSIIAVDVVGFSPGNILSMEKTVSGKELGLRGEGLSNLLDTLLNKK